MHFTSLSPYPSPQPQVAVGGETSTSPLLAPPAPRLNPESAGPSPGAAEPRPVSSGLWRYVGSPVAGALNCLYSLGAPPIAGVRHYRGSPVGKLDRYLALGGFGPFMKELLENHDKATPARPNFAAATFYLLNQPCLLILNSDDHRSVDQEGKLTKSATADGGSILGPIADLLGNKTLVMMEAHHPDGAKNADYWSRKRVIQSEFMNNRQIGRYSRNMCATIDRHLSSARQQGRVELSDFLLKMVTDVEGGYLGFEKYPPSALFRDDPSMQRFFEQMLPNLTDPLLNVPVLAAGRRARLLDEGDGKIREFGSKMMAGNYECIVDRRGDAGHGGFQPSLLDRLGGISFGRRALPDTAEEFDALCEARPEEAMDLMRGIYSLQVVAGEYTAQVLNFAIRELMNHEGLRERMRSAVDGDVDLRDFTLKSDTFDRLPTICSFALEALRKYPPVSIQVGVAKESYPATVGGQPVTIPKGTLVVMDNRRINASTLDDPADAFRPAKHWPIGKGQFEKTLRDIPRNTDAFHTFGGTTGVPNRHCPAHRFAIVEIVAVLANIVKNDDLQAFDEGGNALSRAPLEAHMPSTLRPKQPIHVQFQPRGAAEPARAPVLHA